jgi:hypothetical protein
VCWCYVLRWYDVCDVTECASTFHTGQAEKFLPDHGGNLTCEVHKNCGFDSHRGQANFSACLVWMHTQVLLLLNCESLGGAQIIIKLTWAGA